MFGQLTGLTLLDLWQDSEQIRLFLVAKLLYNYLCPTVRLSVCQPRLGGNVIFSAPNWDITPIFFVQIPLINEHLFCKYFVRLSVGDVTKALLLMDVFIFVLKTNQYIICGFFIYKLCVPGSRRLFAVWIIHQFQLCQQIWILNKKWQCMCVFSPDSRYVDPDPVGSAFIWVQGSGSTFGMRIRILGYKKKL